MKRIFDQPGISFLLPSGTVCAKQLKPLLARSSPVKRKHLLFGGNIDQRRNIPCKYFCYRQAAHVSKRLGCHVSPMKVTCGGSGVLVFIPRETLHLFPLVQRLHNSEALTNGI